MNDSSANKDSENIRESIEAEEDFAKEQSQKLEASNTDTAIAYNGVRLFLLRCFAWCFCIASFSLVGFFVLYMFLAAFFEVPSKFESFLGMAWKAITTGGTAGVISFLLPKALFPNNSGNNDHEK